MYAWKLFSLKMFLHYPVRETLHYPRLYSITAYFFELTDTYESYNPE